MAKGRSRSEAALALVLAIGFGSAGCARARPTEPQAPPVTISVSPAGDRVTLTAVGVPRSRVLAELRAKGVDLRPYDVADGVITVRVTDVSWQTAIEQILPAGARYALRTPGEVALSEAHSGPKRGESIAATAYLPTKDEPRKDGPLSHPERKVESEQWRELPYMEGPGRKPVAARVAEVKGGTGAKQVELRHVEPATVQLTFSIESPDRIRLLGRTLVEGEVPQSRAVTGPLLFALRASDGSTVYSGSLLDPLAVHSYRADGTHSEDRGKEGVFGLLIPRRFVEGERLAALELVFYDARDNALPRELDEASLARIMKEVKPLAHLGGRELLQSSQGERK